MFKSFRIGSIAGIPIKLDITFLIILPIFAWIIGIQIVEVVGLLNGLLAAAIDPEPLTVGNRPWYLGLAAAIGLFVGVIFHELGHSMVAIRYGYPISSITLWLLGGVAQLEEQPRDWRHELLIALAGPIVSVATGVLCYVGLVYTPVSADGFRFVFGYLAIMNVFLAAFNMLPGFPMDGGRVLRALLARNQSFLRATQQAAEVGKFFALALGLLGLLALNFILIALAFFIYIAAAGESRQLFVETVFEGVTVADVMTPVEETATVSPEATVADLLERMFHERHTGYPVVVGKELVGIVTFEDVQSVQPDDRPTTPVREIMSTELKTISPTAQAMDALREMQRHGVGRLIVTDNGRLSGIISRTDLMRALTILEETQANRLGTGTPTSQKSR